MDKFEYGDYKALITDLMADRKKRGQGTNRKLAEAIGVHTTYLTHVLRGTNHLSPEQTLATAKYFMFNAVETDFFVLLVQENRAGDEATRSYYRRKIEEAVRRGRNLQDQLEKKQRLTLEEQNVFYSDWTYSAVRLCTALPQGKDASDIANILRLPIETVLRNLDFLLSCGLCRREDDGRLAPGDASTYVGSDSPMIRRFHANWRLRSLVHGAQTEEDLMYTTAVTLTERDFFRLRARILEWIKEFEAEADLTVSEEVAYLCLDWVRLTSMRS